MLVPSKNAKAIAARYVLPIFLLVSLNLIRFFLPANGCLRFVYLLSGSGIHALCTRSTLFVLLLNNKHRRERLDRYWQRPSDLLSQRYRPCSISITIRQLRSG
jgi:hypothetical protein